MLVLSDPVSVWRTYATSNCKRGLKKAEADPDIRVSHNLPLRVNLLLSRRLCKRCLTLLHYTSFASSVSFHNHHSLADRVSHNFSYSKTTAMRSPSSPKARYGNGARTHDVEMQAMPVLEDTTGIWVPSGPSAVVQLVRSPSNLPLYNPRHPGTSIWPCAHAFYLTNSLLQQPHRNRPQNATPQHDGPKNDNQQYKPRDYKDAVGRYSDVNEEWKTRDHCIDPEDGRLAILRVQHAKGNAAPNPRHLPTPWERPLEPSTAQRWWRRLRNASTEILLWTYADALDGHSAPHKQGGKHPPKT